MQRLSITFTLPKPDLISPEEKLELLKLHRQTFVEEYMAWDVGFELLCIPNEEAIIPKEEAIIPEEAIVPKEAIIPTEEAVNAKTEAIEKHIRNTTYESYPCSLSVCLRASPCCVVLVSTAGPGRGGTLRGSAIESSLFKEKLNKEN